MVGIGRFDNWFHYRSDDMSRMSDLDIIKQDKEAETGDYANEDCREPDQKSYADQVLGSDEYKADMEEIASVIFGYGAMSDKTDMEDLDQDEDTDPDAGYDEYKEKRAGVWKEMGWK
jgi:hypothetical protein